MSFITDVLKVKLIKGKEIAGGNCLNLFYTQI